MTVKLVGCPDRESAGSVDCAVSVVFGGLAELPCFREMY